MHGFQITLVTHILPLWFLVVALFLPRIALALAWLQGNLVPFHLHGWVPVVAWAIVPRILILVLIYQDLGLGWWFLIDAVVMLLVWTGVGGRQARRRRQTQ